MRVWDLPVRLFHWILVALVVAAIVTENIGGNAMIWHSRIGYAMLTLLTFRLLWGDRVMHASPVSCIHLPR